MVDVKDRLAGDAVDIRRCEPVGYSFRFQPGAVNCSVSVTLKLTCIIRIAVIASHRFLPQNSLLAGLLDWGIMAREPYERRLKGPPDSFTYEIPTLVRNRIAYCIKDFCQAGYGSMGMLFKFLIDTQLRKYGGMIPGPELNQYTMNYVQHLGPHWDGCHTEAFLALLEWTFESTSFHGNQLAVDAFNEIFRSEGIGYELSPYNAETTQQIQPNGNLVTSTVVVAFPEVTKKTDQRVHATVIIPALHVLKGKLWSVANDELLAAHRHFKNGDYAEAIYQAGCSLESVLKIICTKNKWPILPDKDTLNPLLQAAYKGGLFDSPHIDIIQHSSGAMRNKWGGHGKAKTTYGPATFEIADNMVQITSSHILFLARQAKLG